MPPKVVVDIASQTNISGKQDGSCQTDSPERQDFQVQTNDPKQSESIATQTENSPKYDFQSQANIQREGSSVAVQTIKEEVAMPNIPNSAAPISAKKRKLSSTSSSRSTNQPPQSISNGAGDQLNNMQVAVDDAILNSEVYKIYCRYEDPKEAIKQIKELKTCIYFHQATEPILAEETLKRESEKTLNELWKVQPLDDSKFVKIRKYVNFTAGYSIFNLNDKMSQAINYRFTRINMLLPNGYECWYVSNIEKGTGLSKWYRAQSTSSSGVGQLAQLNVMGITEATIQKLQYDHFLKEKSEKTLWFDFAYTVLGWHMGSFFPSRRCPSFQLDFAEAETDTENVVNASLRLTDLDDNSLNWKTFKIYHGKSTRPLKKTRRPRSQEEKNEMKKEAKKAAMMEIFKDRFGFTEFKDLYVDELYRSIDI